MEKQLRDLVKDDPVCRLLMSMPGVGAVVALTFKAAIDDPTRFQSSKDVGPWVGLTPRRDQSGERDVQHHGIAAVRLQAIARLHRNERGRHDNAVMPHFDKLAIQAVSAWSCFVAEKQSTSAGAKLLHQLADVIRTVRNRTTVTDLSPHVRPAQPRPK